MENSYPVYIWRIHTVENSYLVFRRSGQHFLLIIQVIDPFGLKSILFSSSKAYIQLYNNNLYKTSRMNIQYY